MSKKEKSLDQMLAEIHQILEEEDDAVANSQPIKAAPTAHVLHTSGAELHSTEPIHIPNRLCVNMDALESIQKEFERYISNSLSIDEEMMQILSPTRILNGNGFRMVTVRDCVGEWFEAYELG